MRISIFGLGYVGSVTAACIAGSGHEVIAVDLDAAKVDSINKGRSPVVEPGLREMIARNVAAGRLKATTSCAEAVMHSSMSLICVGTPGHDDGSLNLNYVRTVCADIGAVLKKKYSYHSVVLRSTVLPGTSRDVAIPAIEKASGKKAGVGFGFGSNPEFLREGSAIKDYFNPPKTVIGAVDKKTAEALALLYQDMKAPGAVTDIEIAEGVKYADNAWHASKIAFANEMGNILQAHGVDSHRVMEIFCTDTVLNISPAYLKPGFAFGGSCLPKDLRAIRASARAKGVKTPLFDAVLEANAAQVRRAHEMVMKSGKKRVGLMGIAFKAGTDDLRESPLVTLAGLLVGSGFELAIYDPSAYESARARGTDVSKYLVATPDELLAHAEILIIGNHGADFGHIVDRANDNAEVIDLVRLKCGTGEGREGYTGICW